MRTWAKEIFTYERGKLLLVFVVFLTIWNYFLLSIPLSIMLVSLLVLFFISNVYHKYFVMELGNNKRIVRLFPGEFSTLTFHLKGKSIVPVYYGKLSFQASNAIMLGNAKQVIERRDMNDYFYDVSSGRNEYEFEIQAVKRGRAVLREIEIQVFDPTFLGSSSYKYRPFYRTEILVLPELKAVNGIEKLLSNEVGSKPSTYSYFQDPLMISGVRDYTPNDSFQQIHWKASARMGTLQTKVLEKTTHRKWTFVLNILEQGRNGLQLSVAKDLEKRLSHLAYLFQMAEKQGATFEIYVNILARNDLQLLHLKEGSGKDHVIRGLELLARIDHMSATVRVSSFIKKIDMKLRQSSTVILCGISKDEVFETIPQLQGYMLPFYVLSSTMAEGVIESC
ncbi:DUF58 domain-containing protein [Bacillus suaedaesalsae]|uniref:DUF58 domain-containing protein n=1 Tax=Bacillus suaedaesalsae TaxID=2810349 RepID=A0ABS2DGX7_9BACI|nr:DUF58 domain-containing protein [Bacillus suaedaesalsae]